MKEEWREIPGFEGYRISNFGRLQSCRVVGNRYSLGEEWRDCKDSPHRNGSHRIFVIRKMGERKCRTFIVHRLVWEVFKGQIPKGYQIDHIDGNSSDSRLCNLRLATPSQNQGNRFGKRGGLYKGIYQDKNGRWVASIRPNRKNRYLGTFDEPKDAARAYDKAALEVFGEFARINFPVN